MNRSSGLALLVALCLPGAAHAAADGHARAPELPGKLVGATLVVHYAEEVPEPIAQEMLTAGETAYAAIRSEFGMPAHVPDGDGLIDVYIYDLQLNPESAAAITVSDDPSAPTASSYIRIKTRDAMTGGAGTLAHELVHVFQMSVFQPTNGPDPGASHVLLEATAQLAAVRFAKERLAMAVPGLSLGDPATAYGQWTFFESLAQDHGLGIVGAILQREAAMGAADRTGRPLEAIAGELAARGSSLESALATHAVRMAGGGFTLPYLRRGGPAPTLSTTVVAGRRPTLLKAVSATLPHQAYQLVSLKPKRRKPCRAGRLELAVDVPSGAPAPVLVAGGKPTAMKLTGTRATLRRRWKHCTQKATLVLVNPSAADGFVFGVGGLYKP